MHINNLNSMFSRGIALGANHSITAFKYGSHPHSFYGEWHDDYDPIDYLKSS
jgi:hypothetical protein